MRQPGLDHLSATTVFTYLTLSLSLFLELPFFTGLSSRNTIWCLSLWSSFLSCQCSVGAGLEVGPWPMREGPLTIGCGLETTLLVESQVVQTTFFWKAQPFKPRFWGEPLRFLCYTTQATGTAHQQPLTLHKRKKDTNE